MAAYGIISGTLERPKRRCKAAIGYKIDAISDWLDQFLAQRTGTHHLTKGEEAVGELSPVGWKYVFMQNVASTGTRLFQ